jgi:uncharacterized protein (TIGR02996 family)
VIGEQEGDVMADAAEKEGLPRAINESPNDDTPRLVYADWLDEHGDPNRAEFIRVGCQKEREEYYSPRWLELNRREGKLASRYAQVWKVGLPALPAKAFWWDYYRRGFIEGATCQSMALFQRESARLRAATPC